MPAATATAATTARTSASSAPRASSQARTRDGIALVPFGATVTRPMVATALRAVAASRADSTAAASRSIGSSRSTSRVVPAWLASPSRSSRHRPCGQMPLGDADRSARVDQAAALLDVQLDQGADPAQRLVVAAELLGIVPGRAHRVGQGGAVGVGELPGPVRRPAHR